jgi:thiol-disulfide isomerase/thioredoxin
MTFQEPNRRTAIITAAAALQLAAALPNIVAGQNAIIQSAPNPRPRSHDLIGKPAPAIDLAKVGGGRLTNQEFAGKTTIVQFWGLWCPDCLRDTDDVAILTKRVASVAGLKFVSVHTRGRYGRWGNVEAFFAEKGYSYPVAIDDDQTAYRAWAVKWVPSFLIVNRQGIITDYTTDLTAGGGQGVDGLLTKARAVARA